MVDLDPQSIITVGKAVLDILRDIKSLTESLPRWFLIFNRRFLNCSHSPYLQISN